MNPCVIMTMRLTATACPVTQVNIMVLLILESELKLLENVKPNLKNIFLPFKKCTLLRS